MHKGPVEHERPLAQAPDTLITKIQERPLQALVCAVTLGLVLGIIWRI